MSSVVEPAARPTVAGPTVAGRGVAGTGGGAIVAVGVALVGVAAAVDPAGIRPFSSLRWAMVSTGVCAGALAVRHWSLPRWHLVAWSILGLAMTAGALAGPDTTTAWLGHPQRHLGVFAWVVFALACALGAHLTTRPRAMRALELLAVVVAGNVVATSVADAAGWDPAGSSFDGGRIGGVFGQPVVLATVAALLLPAVVAARRVGRLRWAIAFGLLITIVLTQTRGAVVGLVAIAVVGAPTWTTWMRRVRPIADTARGRVLVASALAAIVAAVSLTPFAGRLGDVAASSRVDEWALGVDVLADNPWVGVGPEGYRIAVLDHLDAGYVDAYGRDVIVDRAHSAPLDVALGGGVAAGVAYVALTVSVTVATWRRQRGGARTASERFAVAAGLGAVGAFAAAWVAFPVPEVDVIAWLLAGVALGRNPSSGAGGWRRRAGVGVVAVAVAATAIAGWAGVTDVLTDRDMGTAVRAAAAGRTSAAVDAAERAVHRRGDLVDAHWLAATVAASGPTILDVDRALDATEAGLARFPRDPALRDLHVDLLVERALRSRSDVDVATAAAALDDLAQSDPTSRVVESGTQRLAEACLIRCTNRP